MHQLQSVFTSRSFQEKLVVLLKELGIGKDLLPGVGYVATSDKCYITLR
jgi:intein/homing endonuclease